MILLMMNQPGRDLKNKNYKYHWVTEQGIFLTWHDEGKGIIKTLGSDIKTNVLKVYWSVNLDKSIEITSFKVYLTIEDIETSEIYAETNILIKQKKSGYFSIDK